jgi:hypothetical protein
VASDAANKQDAEALRALLADVQGVAHLVIDPDMRTICVIPRPGSSHEEIADTVRSIAQGYAVIVAFEPEARLRQRVRFVSVERDMEPDQQIRYTVTLEWGGLHETATAVGDKGENVELRTAAVAALGAVTGLVPEPLGIRLAGVKQVRAFDSDLIVVSLYRSEMQPQNLVGAVVAGDDTARAAVSAVLNSLNRLLGNYLAQVQ